MGASETNPLTCRRSCLGVGMERCSLCTSFMFCSLARKPEAKAKAFAILVPPPKYGIRWIAAEKAFVIFQNRYFPVNIPRTDAFE